MSARDSDETPQREELTRREILQGRLSRLGIRPFRRNEPVEPQASAPPRVMRYPRSQQDVMGFVDGDRYDAAAESTEADAPPATSLKGISIVPVPTRGGRASLTATRHGAVPVFRPPGAIDEYRFRQGCTRCGACIDACPHDAIVQAPESLRGVAGTPIIDPDSQPCLMCADYSCIRSCEPGVLSHSVPKMMGTAKITEHLCVAYHGTACTVCSDHCPVERAIDTRHGKPAIREDICSGCGVCRQVCPAPENAILLMPTFSRPSGPRPDDSDPGPDEP